MSKFNKWVHKVLAVGLGAALLLSPLAAADAADVQETNTGASAASAAAIYAHSQPGKYAASVNYTLKANGVAVPVIQAYSDYGLCAFLRRERADYL